MRTPDPDPQDGLGSSTGLQIQVYDELHRLAQRYLSGERREHTLQATALVHEAWLRVGEHGTADRDHFLALSARAMRRVLVDHARSRARQKRGGDWERVTLSGVLLDDDGRDPDVLEIHELLERLAERDERAARVVELRFFGGLTVPEVARVLGVSTGTVDTDWFAAKAWLLRELRRADRA